MNINHLFNLLSELYNDFFMTAAVYFVINWTKIIDKTRVGWLTDLNVKFR